MGGAVRTIAVSRSGGGRGVAGLFGGDGTQSGGAWADQAEKRGDVSSDGYSLGWNLYDFGTSTLAPAGP